MNARLTAAEAAKMSEDADPTKSVNEILAQIEAQAKKGKREFIVRAYGFSDSVCYTNEENYPDLCKAILAELRALGFQVRKGTGGNQFLDLWLEISW